jgi:hypothetical protein
MCTQLAYTQVTCSKANMMFAHSMSLAITRLALARRGASLTYKLMDKYSQIFRQIELISSTNK